MDNKLQELTDRLYQEGLSKGRQEADQLLEKARKEAQEIVAKAQEEAEAIRSDAEKRAVKIRTMVQGDIKMASTQTISALKQEVENMVITKAVAGPVDAALSDEGFVKDLIAMVVRAFNAANPDGMGLDVILPTAALCPVKDPLATDLSPVASRAKLIAHILEFFPDAGPKTLEKLF